MSSWGSDPSEFWGVLSFILHRATRSFFEVDCVEERYTERFTFEFVLVLELDFVLVRG